MIKIYVDTEQEKQQLIEESEYIHYFSEVIKYQTKEGKIKEKIIELDSDKAGILMHIYMNPSIIVVNNNLAEQENKFTEGQLDKAISWGINSGRKGDVTITDIDNFIQSLKQPKQ